MAEGMPPGVWAQLTARVHAVSRRPRMALLVALLLVERADDTGMVQTSRADLAQALQGLVGQRGYAARRAARHERIGPLLEERRRVQAQAREVIGQAPRRSLASSAPRPPAATPVVRAFHLFSRRKWLQRLTGVKAKTKLTALRRRIALGKKGLECACFLGS